MSGRTISTSTGRPVRALKSVPICHPPSTAFTSGLALAPCAFPAPYGNSYSALILKLWRTSEMLSPCSDVKLKLLEEVRASLQPLLSPMLCDHMYWDPSV